MQRVGHIQDGEHNECLYVTTLYQEFFSLENSIRDLSLEMLLIFDSNILGCRAFESTFKLPWRSHIAEHYLVMRTLII